MTNKKIKLFISILLSILILITIVFFSCNGIEYYREVKSEKVLTEYLKSQNQKKYDDYMMAVVKEDRYIASLRLNQSMWVIFEDEPSYIYQYLFDASNELHLYEIKNMSDNTIITKGKHGIAIDDKDWIDKPLNIKK